MHLFILGGERSGSTWLSNIIDSHPSVEFFMEPFADYAGLFPGYPTRNLYLQNSNNGLKTVLLENFPRLKKRKYILGNRRNGSLDKILFSIFKVVCKITKCRQPKRIEHLELLNLNKKEMGFFQVNYKNKTIDWYVIKELRLNFQLGLISEVFPFAKYLLIVRHPGAQISSIIRLMKERRLGELKRSLFSLPEYIKDHQRFKKYAPLIDRVNWGKNLDDMLIAWWIINYDTLIEDCKKLNLDHMIVYHEELSEEPNVEIEKLFQYIGIEYSKEVKQFVQMSSTTKKNVRSPLDTMRESTTYYKEQIDKSDMTILRKISQKISSIEVSEELKKYI